MVVFNTSAVFHDIAGGRGEAMGRRKEIASNVWAGEHLAPHRQDGGYERLWGPAVRLIV